MSDQYQAIPTTYNDIMFRSRLEARWAVFYNEMGIEWEYEPEGFNLSKYDLGWYVPDFFLPRFETFIEIKGKQPNSKEIDKIYGLSDATDNQVILFWGNIIEHAKGSGMTHSARYIEEWGEGLSVEWHHCFCGEITISPNLTAWGQYGNCQQCGEMKWLLSDSFENCSPASFFSIDKSRPLDIRTYSAYKKAMSYRFW